MPIYRTQYISIYRCHPYQWYRHYCLGVMKVWLSGISSVFGYILIGCLYCLFGCLYSLSSRLLLWMSRPLSGCPVFLSGCLFSTKFRRRGWWWQQDHLSRESGIFSLWNFGISGIKKIRIFGEVFGSEKFQKICTVFTSTQLHCHLRPSDTNPR